MPEIFLILIRSVISFVVLFVLARMMGKQQLTQLTFFDYVVGITIGSIAAAMSVDQNILILNGLVALVVWGSFSILMALISLKSFSFRKFTDGQPVFVIKNGKLQEKNLNKLRITVDQLMPLLRGKNVFKMSDVELAIMETNGELTVMKKSDVVPITPKILGIQTEEEQQPQIVVIDGKLIEESLNKTGYSKEWLLAEAMKQGADSLEDVFIAQIDSKGSVYIDLYEDQMKKPIIKERSLINATLKKAQGDLETYSLQTENQDAKENYHQQAEKLKEVINQLQPYLKD